MHRIVLVEDDPALRYLLKSELESTGRFTVIGEAPDGAAGIKEARRCRATADLVLLDLNMPIMDGMTALPQIREAAPKAVVVVLTMRPREQFEAEALRLGAAAFLDKALAADSLAQRLVEIMDVNRTKGSVEPLRSS
jgi:DNA-binding NarL/FixJ family response regulator